MAKVMMLGDGPRALLAELARHHDHILSRRAALHGVVRSKRVAVATLREELRRAEAELAEAEAELKAMVDEVRPEHAAVLELSAALRMEHA